MLSQKHLATALASLLLAATVCARAEAAEPTMSYAGRIVSAVGKPLNGTYDVEVRFFGSPADVDQLGAPILVSEVPFVDGMFQIPFTFGGAELNAIFGDYSTPVYVEVRMGGKSYPRQRFMATPYALRVPIDNKTLRYDDDGKLAVGPATGPAANQFLTKDGTGNFVWATPEPRSVTTDPTGLVAGDEGKVWFNTTTNQLKYWDGSAAITLGAGGGGGLVNLSGQTGPSQTLTLGSAGNSPAWAHSANDHTLNIPMANAGAAVTAGLISNADYVSIGNKVAKSGDAMSGDLSMSGNKVTNVGTPVAVTDAAPKGYVDTALTGKAAAAHTHGNADIVAGVDAAKISTGTVSNAEFNYLDGVTASIQGQIDATNTAVAGKQASLGYVPLNKAGDSMVAALGLASLASDPAGLVVADKGKVWFNSTSGEVKYWNGTAAVALGAAGSGLGNLSGETGSTQTLSIGAAGTAPAWTHAANDHKIDIPLASGAGVTAGLISKADYDAFNGKANATHTHGDADINAGVNATKIGAGLVDNTEFGYLNGVTAGIQGQIDAANTAIGGKAAATHTHGNADILAGVAATKISAGNVSNTEFDYLDGVTSGIQGQIDTANTAIAGKAAAAHTHGDADINAGVNATKIGAGLVDNTEFGYLNNASSNIQGQIDAANTAIAGKQASLGYTPVNKAGDVMTGTFGLASLASDPAGLVMGDKGKVWFNSTSGEVKYWNGSAPIALGAAGSGLGNLSGETGSTQTLSLGSSGSAPAWTHAGNDHKLDIPLASTVGVSAGLISRADYDLFLSKEPALGFTPLNKGGDTFTGAMNGGGYDVTNLGHVALGSNKTLAIGAYAADPGGLGALDAGKIWWNSTSGQVKYWDGSAAKVVGSNTITTTEIANGTIIDADISASAAIDPAKIAGGASVSSAEFGYLDGVTSSIQTQLAGKAATAHTHGNADINAGVDAAKISAGNVSNTEFDYLDGVTSSIQTQFAGKAPTAHSHGNAEITAGVDAAKISAGNVSNTEFDYLDGVTGAIQTQLAGKAPTAHSHGNAEITAGVDAAKISAGNVSNTEFDYLDGVTSAIQTQLAGKQASLGYSPVNKAGDVMTGTFGLASLASDPAGLVAGDKGKVWYNSTSGEVKYWNGSAPIALGAAGSGLGNLSGETGSTQTLSLGAAGTAPAWTHASNDHKLDIPMASAAGVTAGLLSKSDYDAFNGKQAALGYTPLDKGGDTFAGNMAAAGYNITGLGNVELGANKTLQIGAYAADPSGFGALDAGRVWWNSTSGQVKYWDGSSAKVVGSNTVTTTEIANGTIIDADISASAAIDPAKIAGGASVSSTEFGYLDGVTSAIQTQLAGKAAAAHNHGDAEINAGVSAAKISAGNVSNTEFDYLDGVTSSIQTQLAGKAATAHSHGNAEITAGVDAAKISAGNVSNTEFDYLDGVTGAIQTQLAGKAPTAHSHGNTEITAGVDAAKISGGSVSNTEFDYLDGVTSAIQTQLSGKIAATGGVMTGTFGLASLASDPAGLVAGDKGKVWYNSTSGEVKYWNGTAPVALGAAGSGLGNLSGETGSTQTLSVGSTGTAPAWVHASNDHTLNIPLASGAGVTAGLISKAQYDTFNGKQAALGYTALNKGGDTFAGHMAAAGYNVTGLGNVELGSNKTLQIGAYAADPGGFGALDAGRVWWNSTSGQVKYWDGSAAKVVGTNTVTSTEIANGTIVDADVSGSAAIATSKLSGAVTSITGHGLGSLATLSTVGSSEITNGSIADTDISASAAIATSKLSGAVTSIAGHGLGSLATLSAVGSSEITNGSIADTDISASAAISATKIGATTNVSNTEYGYLDGVTSAIQTQLNAKLPLSGGSMTGTLQFWNTNVDPSFAGGGEGTTWFNTSSNKLFYWDGTVAQQIGGAIGSSGITDNSIMNADVNASAAIATSKLSGAVTSIAGHGLGSLATLSAVGSSEITNGSIMDTDINASAAIADTKLATISTGGKVSGTAITSGNIATSGDFTTTGSVGIGSAAPTSKLDVVSTSTATVDANGTLTAWTWNPGANVNSTSQYFVGSKSTLNIPSSNVRDLSQALVRGASASATHTGTGSLSQLVGSVGSASLAGSGTLTTGIGALGSTQFTSGATGVMTNAIGVAGQVNLLNQPTGTTVSNVYGVRAGLTDQAAGATTSTYAGLYVMPPQSAGTVTTSYGLFLSDQTLTGGGTQTNAPFGIYQNGSNRNYFAGKVGIGSTNPAYELDVNGTIRASSGFIGNSNFNNSNINNTSAVGIGTTSPGADLSLGGTAARTVQVDRNTTAAAAGQNLTVSAGGTKSGNSDYNGGSLILSGGTATGAGSSTIEFKTATAGTSGSADRAPSTKMVILGNGNVGIGSATPGVPLDVAGQIDSFDANARIRIAPAAFGTDMPGIRTTTDDPLHFGTNDTNRMTITNTGNVGIGYASPTNVLQVGNTGHTGYGLAVQAGSAGQYGAVIQTTATDSNAALWVRNSSTGTSYFRAQNDGNVGINTATPTAKFQVEGGQFVRGGDGDANGDGSLVAGDLLTLVNYLNAGSGGSLTPLQYSRLDISGDGRVDILDYDMILDVINAAKTVAQAQTAGKAIANSGWGINKSGNVGIGTISQDKRLMVSSLSAESIPLRLHRQNGTDGAFISMQYSANDDGGTVKTYASTSGIIEDSAAGAEYGAFSINTVANAVSSEKVRVNSAGNVGIGTNNPTAKLHVGGTAGTDGIKFPDGSLQTTAAVVAAIRDEARNLKVVNGATSATQVTITADEIVLKNATGGIHVPTTVSVTATITTAGANGLDTGSEAASTWYHVWVISDGSTVGALLSTSATAPTMPGAYTYKAYAGAIYNDASSNFISIVQRGKKVIRTAVNVLNAGYQTAWTSVSLTTAVPTTAAAVTGYTGVNVDEWVTPEGIFVATTSTGLGETRHVAYVESGLSSDDGNNMQFNTMINTAQTIYYKCWVDSYGPTGSANCGSGGADVKVDLTVTGWEFP